MNAYFLYRCLNVRGSSRKKMKFTVKQVGKFFEKSCLCHSNGKTNCKVSNQSMKRKETPAALLCHVVICFEERINGQIKDYFSLLVIRKCVTIS